MARDEDCDPTTIGELDIDGDGFTSSACCNPAADGGFLCGTDCNDLIAGVNPNVPEVCDGVDNDCDGTVDEGVHGAMTACFG